MRYSGRKSAGKSKLEAGSSNQTEFETEQPSKVRAFFWATVFGLLSFMWIYSSIYPSGNDSPLLFFILGTFSFLACIYNIRKVSRQHKDEEAEEYNHLTESELRDRYPHIIGKIEDSHLKMFARNAETGTPLLKLSFLLYLQESTKIDFSEGSFKWDNLWDITEELLEHLEKFHEGSTIEHEIAVAAFWYIAAIAVGELIEEDPEIEGAKLEVEPFTDIDKIVSLFPKKDNHPSEELSFFDEKGSLLREPEGSTYIQNKLTNLGL